jgi:hypothetical protein
MSIEGSLAQGRGAVTQHILDQLPVARHRTASNACADGGEGGEGATVAYECSICLMNFADGEWVRSLQCVHRFHVACIDRWLRMKDFCPNCKGVVTAS